MDNVSAVLTSTGRSFHHRGARTESSRERAVQVQDLEQHNILFMDFETGFDLVHVPLKNKDLVNIGVVSAILNRLDFFCYS